MSFDIVRTTLSQAVATSGTFTVSYPSGRSAGNYAGAIGHKMRAMMSDFTSPVGFTVAFGSSSITVTYLGSTTIPAGSNVALQLERVGTDGIMPTADRLKSNTFWYPTAYIDLGSPAAASSTSLCASQSVSSGVAAVINGALASGGVGVMDAPRNVVAAWTTSAILTVTGTDVDGNTVVEKSASGVTFTGKKAFKTVTSMTFNASVTGMTAGTGDVLGLPFYVPSSSYIVAEWEAGVRKADFGGIYYMPFEIEATELAAATNEELVCPVGGRIRRIRAVVQTAIVTGGAITVNVNTVAVDGLTITAADSDAAGVRYTDTPTAGHATAVVAAGDRISIVSASAFNGGGAINGVLEIEVTDPINGTFVAGVTSTATATTGDTRGTYDPVTACDGTTAFGLLVYNPDPTNAGVAQYTG